MSYEYRGPLGVDATLLSTGDATTLTARFYLDGYMGRQRELEYLRRLTFRRGPAVVDVQLVHRQLSTVWELVVLAGGQRMAPDEIVSLAGALVNVQARVVDA